MKVLFDEKFRVGQVIVDPQSNVISLAGKEKRLEPKLIALLIYLAQHAHQVITRQQITDAIWPDVIVGEESITQAIFALRNALGDDAKRPTYIETIPKKGYRFLTEAVAVQQDNSAAVTSVPRKSRWPSMALLAVIALTFAAVALWYHWPAPRNYEIANILPVTKMSGAECCMAINGDRKMAFVNSVESGSDIYIRDLQTGTQERLTDDKWQKGLLIWLDDNTLIYPRCMNGQCQVVQQHLQQSPQIIYTSNAYVGEITLNPADPNMLLINEQSQQGSEFMLFDLRSGKQQKLRESYADLPTFIVHPAFTKGASHLYFVSVDTRPIRLMALNLETKHIQLISEQFDDIKSFSFDKSQQLLIAGVHQSRVGIWQLDSAGGQPTLLVRSSGNEQFLFPLADPDERAIYYQNVQVNQDVGSIATASGSINELPKLNTTGTEEWARLSADGQFIYFVSDRSGFSEVWRYDLTTKQTKPITHLNTSTIKLLLPSRDGQRFSALYTDKLQLKLGVFSVHTGELLASIESHAYPLSWSLDDKYIYAEDHQDNLRTLRRYDSQTLAYQDIQKNAGVFAEEAEDGISLLFMDLEKNVLVVHNMTTSEQQILRGMEMKLVDMWPGQIRLDATGKSLLAVNRSQEFHQLWRYPIAGTDESPSKIADLAMDIWVDFIKKDGSGVLYGKQMPTTGDIMKVELR